MFKGPDTKARSIVAVMRQREYFVQAIRRTTCVASSHVLDQSNFQASKLCLRLEDRHNSF